MAYVDNHSQRISSHDQAEESPAIAEPVVVPSVFITGGIIEVTDSCVRFVGWEQLPDLNNGEMVERRISARLVMSNEVARDLVANWRNALTKGGH
jgi:hypothetical protein